MFCFEKIAVSIWRKKEHRLKIFWMILCAFLQIIPLSAQKIKLFDGKDLKNWYAFVQESGKHENATDIFHVENRLIRLYGDKIGYLMTNKSFSNFKLTAEFRWNADSIFVKRSKTPNSGLMYLVPDSAKDRIWCAGIQFQIKPNNTGDFIFLGGITAEINGEKTIAGKSITYPKIKSAEKSMGKWNQIEVKFRKNEIYQYLNGKLVNKTQNPSVHSGRILLQYEGFPIDFRNITIQCYE